MSAFFQKTLKMKKRFKKGKKVHKIKTTYQKFFKSSRIIKRIIKIYSNYLQNVSRLGHTLRQKHKQKREPKSFVFFQKKS